MPAALPADWNGLRLMNLQGHTLEELAELSGINLNTLKARSAREGWSTLITEKKEQKQAQSVAVATSKGQMQPAATSAVDLTAITLEKGAKMTRLGLTNYAAKMAKQAEETGILEEAPLYKAVADIHAKMHPEQQVQTQIGIVISASVLSGQDYDAQCGPVIDV